MRRCVSRVCIESSSKEPQGAVMNENVVPAPVVEAEPPSTTPQVVLLKLDEIEADPEQGRRRFDAATLEGLARSIRECGVLEPILVRLANGESKHRIIAGERRWRAAPLAGLESIPLHRPRQRPTRSGAARRELPARGSR